jgi:hypothetical protein
MLSEMESYEVSEWATYFRIKDRELEKKRLQAEAEARARGGR